MKKKDKFLEGKKLQTEDLEDLDVSLEKYLEGAIDRKLNR